MVSLVFVFYRLNREYVSHPSAINIKHFFWTPLFFVYSLFPLFFSSSVFILYKAKETFFFYFSFFYVIILILKHVGWSLFNFKFTAF